MFGGKEHEEKLLDNNSKKEWRVSWESVGDHRFWCKQEHIENSKLCAVVMFNPGSLSGDGSRLKSDTTLRILRELFVDTSYSPFVINLYSLSAPKISAFFEKWNNRDHPGLSYRSLEVKFSAVMYAYGNYKVHSDHVESINGRVEDVRDFLRDVPEIEVKKNKGGTPKHPMSIQRGFLKEEFRQAIIDHASANLAR